MLLLTFTLVRYRSFLRGAGDSRTSGAAGERYSQGELPRCEVEPPLTLFPVACCANTPFQASGIPSKALIRIGLWPFAIWQPWIPGKISRLQTM